MIKKFTKIQNGGVFRNFEWPEKEKGIDGNQLEFKDINIIYGQNYSGKTTLSRIPRSFEKRQLQEMFESMTFEVLTASNEMYTQLDIHTVEAKDSVVFKVFNEDFTRENLDFYGGETPHSAPFTILGEKNIALESEIKDFEERLGNSLTGEETGLRKQLVQAVQSISETNEQIKKRAIY